MSLDACNGFLKAMEALNDGCNHVCSYSLEKLPEADSLDTALSRYFSRIKTSNSGPHPSEAWSFKLSLLNNLKDDLTPRLHHWFFEQEYSPEDVSRFSHKNTVAGFLDLFLPLIGKGAAGFQLQTHPPDSFWYGCIWEEYAFASETGFWLLHFDFSD
jgi:hypothetical protein